MDDAAHHAREASRSAAAADSFGSGDPDAYWRFLAGSIMHSLAALAHKAAKDTER